MSVGFGFSAGDFIAAIELVGTVIDALRSSGNASTEYRELVRQLLSLETALIQVKRLGFEETQYAEVIALRQAAAQCQRTIDAFWKKAEKYQASLGSGSSSGLKNKWTKIKWALCKKDDVARFKADLVGHTESIQLLLTTVQLGKTNLNEKKQDERHKTLAGRFQDGYFNCMQRLTVVVEQGKQLLDMTATILRTNVKVFQIVLQIQQFITRIPGQVDRQQPVYLIDALGKISPFHLEFVRSAEALVAVLRINFKKHGNGAEKIERGEFAIQDYATKRDINLNTDWEICFTPGQRVVMSMIFQRELVLGITCPKCHNPNFNGLAGEDIECPSCGLTYRRVLDEDEKNLASGLGSNPISPETLTASSMSGGTFGPAPAPLKRKRSDDGFADFRRIRIYDKPLAFEPVRVERWQQSLDPRSPSDDDLEAHETEEDTYRPLLRPSSYSKPPRPDRYRTDFIPYGLFHSSSRGVIFPAGDEDGWRAFQTWILDEDASTKPFPSLAQFKLPKLDPTLLDIYADELYNTPFRAGRRSVDQVVPRAKKKLARFFETQTGLR